MRGGRETSAEAAEAAAQYAAAVVHWEAGRQAAVVEELQRGFGRHLWPELHWLNLARQLCHALGGSCVRRLWATTLAVLPLAALRDAAGVVFGVLPREGAT